MDVKVFIERMLELNQEALSQVPIPPGLESYVGELAETGQTEVLLSLFKLSFLFGVQQGFQKPAQSQSLSA